MHAIDPGTTAALAAVVAATLMVQAGLSKRMLAWRRTRAVRPRRGARHSRPRRR